MEIALLGLVADHQREIKDGKEYDKYFPKAGGTYDIITKNGNVARTVQEMDKLCRSTLADTEKIAPLLRGRNHVETLRNVFDFYYNHVQYHLDRPNVEELRRPRRTWADRKSGVDCDCFSITVASTLLNLGIDCRFRITKYGAGWQHVYVIVPVPTDPKKYHVIDCVLNSFNEEKTYSEKFDHTMKSTQPLSGIPIALLGRTEDEISDVLQDKHDLLKGCHFEGKELHGLGDTEANSPLLASIYDHIVATRDIIRKEPDSSLIVGGAKTYLQMLDYAIANWNTPNRDKALDTLAKEEERWNEAEKKNGVVNGTDGTDDFELGFTDDDEAIIAGLMGLGKFSLKSIGQTFFSNVKKATQAVKKFNDNIKIQAKAAVKKAGEVGQKVIDKTKEVAKKAGALIKKFIILSNPLTLLMRAGFLLAMETNLFQWAQRILPAYFSQAEAEKMGITRAAWELSKRGLEQAENVFVAIGGSRTKLEKYVRKGRASKKLHGFAGLGSLGEPISTVAAIVAAAGTITSAAIKMAQAGMTSKSYAAAQKQHDTAVTEQTRIKYAQARKANGLGDIGDDAAPATDAPVEAPAISEGEAGDKKSGAFKRFIQAIKAFFQRKKNKGEPIPDASSVQNELQKEAGSPSTAAQSVEDVAKQLAEEAKNAAMAQGKSPEEALEAGKNAYINAGGGIAPTSSDGIFSKLKTFVVENPAKAAIGGLVVFTALTLVLSPKARKVVGLSSSTKAARPKAALNGLGKEDVYRKGHKVKKAKAMLPSGSKVKRVVLK